MTNDADWPGTSVSESGSIVKVKFCAMADWIKATARKKKKEPVLIIRDIFMALHFYFPCGFHGAFRQAQLHCAHNPLHCKRYFQKSALDTSGYEGRAIATFPFLPPTCGGVGMGRGGSLGV